MLPGAFPHSSFRNDATKKLLDAHASRISAALACCSFDLESLSTREGSVAARRCLDEHVLAPLASEVREKFSVRREPAKIGAVPCDIIMPEAGVSGANADRLLINLHGGGFTMGRGLGGFIEGAPIAATGRIKVISVHYRMAPEHMFPAASDDVATVYERLLEQHDPSNIGIFGSSAGALLATQTISSLQRRNLPLPAAVALICGAGAYFDMGDSGHFTARMNDPSVAFRCEPARNPYLARVSPTDPTAFPIFDPALLAGFPPALLLSATRDQALSSAVFMHEQLVRAGRPAQLHIWEGLGHCFQYDPRLPEAWDAYRITSKFFDGHLA